jgi:hypothetical protein
VPGAEITVVRLRAPPDVLVDRVLRRGTDRDLAWATFRARQLAREMDEVRVEDVLIDVGDRTPAEVAGEILEQLGWPLGGGLPAGASPGARRPGRGCRRSRRRSGPRPPRSGARFMVAGLLTDAVLPA